MFKIKASEFLIVRVFVYAVWKHKLVSAFCLQLTDFNKLTKSGLDSKFEGYIPFWFARQVDKIVLFLNTNWVVHNLNSVNCSA